MSRAGADERARRASRLLAALLPTLLLGAVPVSGAPDPAAILRKASDTFEAGDAQAALLALRPLEAGPLADHVALLRARWLRHAGELEAAEEAAEQALEHDPPSEVRSLVYLELAATYLQLSQLSDAYRAQREAWRASRSGKRSADLALEFAKIFESRSLPGDARRLYDEIWQTWPRAEASAVAFERGRFLSEATGAPEPTAKALSTYADALRAAYRCKPALPVYARVLEHKLDGRARRSAQRGRADCLFQLRRYSEAEQGYRALVAERADDIDAAIRAARSLARAGQSEAAVKELSAIARRADRGGRARAQYLTAILVGRDDPVSAKRLLRRVEKQRSARGLSRAARWRLAWGELQADEFETAIKRLRPLTRGPLSDIEVQRARYWLAVAQLETDEDRGEENLRELAESLPLSYYGLLAAERLGVAPDLERSFVGDRPGGSTYRPARRARWLLEGGFPELARDELESWLRSKRLERDARIRAAELLHELGDYFRGVRTVIDGFGGALEQGIDPEWSEAWKLAWPRPFDPTVRSATKEFEFDAALVWAVMREESTYRPDIASPAGAIGLMQIIPPTGDQIASYLGIDRFETDRLREPSTNIRFGTFYLKRLVGRFQGSEPLAIAAYNAGPDVVTEWVRRDGPSAHDFFVESVPYSETRRYLRRVIRSQRVYQLLYDE